MTDKHAGPEGREFSRELLRAISADVIVCFVDRPALAGDDLADLKQILLGKRVPKIPVDKKRAISALAHSESSAEASDILGRILSDTKETTGIRAAAAVYLSLMPPAAAEEALLKNINDDDEVIRVRILKSLGSIGTARVLERLQALPAPDTEHTKKQLSMAKLAISFRSGSNERDAQDANTSLGIRWTTHAAKTVEGKRVRENLDALWGSTYGIALNPNIGLELNCGGASHFLFLNDLIKRGAFVESARSRKMIAGLVALAEEGTRYFTIRYLVLTTPSEKGLEVIVTRTNGDVAYVGKVRPDGNEFQLTMRDVGLQRTATEIEGRVSNASIQLNLRIWRGSVRPKRHAVPIRY